MNREEALRTILFHESESWRSNQNLHHDDWRDAIGKTLREYERSVLERVADVCAGVARDAYETGAPEEACAAEHLELRFRKMAEEL